MLHLIEVIKIEGKIGRVDKMFQIIVLRGKGPTTTSGKNKHYQKIRAQVASPKILKISNPLISQSKYTSKNSC